jgi:hypothetical protein
VFVILPLIIQALSSSACSHLASGEEKAIQDTLVVMGQPEMGNNNKETCFHFIVFSHLNFYKPFPHVCKKDIEIQIEKHASFICQQLGCVKSKRIYQKGINIFYHRN